MPFQHSFKPSRKKIQSLQEGRVPFDFIFVGKEKLTG